MRKHHKSKSKQSSKRLEAVALEPLKSEHSPQVQMLKTQPLLTTVEHAHAANADKENEVNTYLGA